MRSFLVSLALVIVGIVAASYYLSVRQPEVAYFTDKVRMDEITEVVPVTGYAEPTEVRVVQSEVLGVVEEVMVDFNDEVKQGDVLARLSSDLQRMQLMKAEADLESAEASVLKAESAKEEAYAARERAVALLDAAEREYSNAKDLVAKSVVEQSKADMAMDAVRQAQAGVAQANSGIKQAEAGKALAASLVSAARAALQAAQLNLEKTELRSNLNGIILNKSIRVGDAVAPGPKVSLSESSPAIFEIAAPLNRMQAIVKVSEADYSRVKKGQKATFTIDAYPDEKFEATVKSVRDAPTSDRTAVSYATVLEFENRTDPNSGEWMVKPRSTISADIEVRRAGRVLAVPNGALLYSPANASIPSLKPNESLVWTVKPGEKPVAHAVKTGISNGMATQLLEGDLKEGDLVITGEPVATSAGFQIPIGN
ncbi:MAG: efflux RND transporter periplasmic adaptor subunit [Planctomycetota bacterium]